VEGYAVTAGVFFACPFARCRVERVSCEQKKIHTLQMIRAVINIGYIL
jgi:hypothetical protein